MDHLDLLFSGQMCFTPKPDWSQAGRRISEGGAINFGPGRKMTPNKLGYVIAGTHAYFVPDLKCKRVTVYVDVPDEVIASRLEGHSVSPKRLVKLFESTSMIIQLPYVLLERKQNC